MKDSTNRVLFPFVSYVGTQMDRRASVEAYRLG